jgi:phosphoglycolate phosphatase-like HAD superfamily hydrolase
VGDHISDMQAAAAVRCRRILVRSGRASSESTVAEVDSVVDDLQSAADLILASS